MNLTRAQANARLSAINSAEELRELIKTIDTRGLGSTTILWSGYAAPLGTGASDGIHSGDITASLRKANTNIRTIATTEAARFLELNKSSPDYNQALDDKLKTLFKNDKNGINDFLYGPSTGNPRTRTGKGVWDDVSANFVKQAQGDVRLVVGGAQLDRVFAQTEIHELLKNTKIKSIEGVPIEALRGLEKSSGVKEVVRLLMGLSEANTGMIQIQVSDSGRPMQMADGTYRLDATDYLKMNTLNSPQSAGMRSVMEFIPDERRLKHLRAVEEIYRLNPILRGMNYSLPVDGDLFRHQQAIARVGSYAGHISDTVSLTTTMAQAGWQLQQGDHRGAHDTVVEWFTETAGGIAAGRLATLLVAPLMATGPLGMLIGAGIIISASLAGSELAKKLRRKVKEGFSELEKTISPLVLDLNGNGIETLALSTTVIHFDHDGNGFAEQTGWVAPSDGFLVLDLNNNGRIDNGGELFGNRTRLANGSFAEHGFAALARYDSNRDNRIDNRDAIWSRLQVWRDRNSNGQSESGELMGLGAANVRALLLSFQNSTQVDRNGNEHRQKGTFLATNGKLADLTDVWFAKDTIRSRQLVMRSVDARTAALPNLPGMGIVPSLHQALMDPQNANLRSLLSQWIGAKRRERIALTEDLLYAWCDAGTNPFGGSDRWISPIVPRIIEKVAVFEKLTGQIVPGTEEGLGYNRAELIGVLTHDIMGLVDMMLHEQLLIDPLIQLATPVESTDFGPIQMDLTASANHLRAQFNRDPDPTFLPMVQWLFSQRGAGGQGFFAALKQAALRTRDAFAIAMAQQQPLQAPGQWITWRAGSLGEDTLQGSHLDDVLEGGEEHDFLEGLAGNDTLIAGGGVDSCSGGPGADAYILSPARSVGYASIFDASSPDGFSDRLIFTDVTSTQVRVEQGSQNMGFFIGERRVAFVANQLNPLHRIEEVHFADGVIWDHTTLLLQTPTRGTHGDDRLVGAPTTSNRLQGLSGNDTLIGGAQMDHLEGQLGNDTLTGLGGRDTLDGGDGHDLLEGGEGGDRYSIGGIGGHDRISDVDRLTSESDRVVFSSLTSGHLTRVQRIGDTLQLHFGSSTSLTLVNQLQTFSRIEEFQFANGTTWDHATVLQRAR